MLSAFQTFGKLGALASSVARAWTPLALWPDGISSAGMWISPSTLASEFNDYTGTTPVATPGTVADSANPVGLALDIRAGATALTDPGNHMLQSTSVDRPLLSARVNLLTYTEDFGNGIWTEYAYGAGAVTKTPNYSLAPDGTTTACRVVATAPTATGTGGVLRYGGLLTGVYTRSIWIKSNTGTSQVITICPGESTATKTVTTTWAEYDWTSGNQIQYLMDVGLYRSGSGYDTDATCDISIWHPQHQIGTQATDYQSIPTDGSTYSSAGITPFQLYDGTDDGMATASFAAGTLIDGMDCLIAVRRESAARVVYCNYDDVNGFFGYAEAGITSINCFGTAVGSPTVWVDNVQLSGGTAVSAATLDTALTVGDWHIIEFRNLDLSTWTNFSFSEYNFYKAPNARGDIMLYPSTASTTDKDNARQYLADKYGVTLA